jgi:hypothetical protein
VLPAKQVGKQVAEKPAKQQPKRKQPSRSRGKDQEKRIPQQTGGTEQLQVSIRLSSRYVTDPKFVNL